MDMVAIGPGGSPREDELTSGCGAGVRGAVDLPPTEAHADQAGLVVWDPGFQELRENEVQKECRTLGRKLWSKRKSVPPTSLQPCCKDMLILSLLIK